MRGGGLPSAKKAPGPSWARAQVMWGGAGVRARVGARVMGIMAEVRATLG